MLQIQVTRWHELQYMPDFYKGSGTYSYQLVFSRSKVVPDGFTQPKDWIFVRNKGMIAEIGT